MQIAHELENLNLCYVDWYCYEPFPRINRYELDQADFYRLWCINAEKAPWNWGHEYNKVPFVKI